MAFKALGWGSNTKEYIVKRKTIRIQLENTKVTRSERRGGPSNGKGGESNQRGRRKASI